MSWTREQMAARAASELTDGSYVNLGIGLPTLVDYLPNDVELVLQSENGILGVGAYPGHEDINPDLINAGKETVTVQARGLVLRFRDVVRDDPRRQDRRRNPGAMQVWAAGDIANWMIPGKMVKGMGGAMDLVRGPGHRADGAPGPRRVHAQDHQRLPAVYQQGHGAADHHRSVCPGHRTQSAGLELVELAPGVSVGEVVAKAEPVLHTSAQIAA